MQIRNHQDFWSGVMFIAFGLFFAIYGAMHYDFGAARRMGPGFFPIALGVLLAVLGLLVLIKALAPSAASSELPRFDLGSVAWVLGAVIVFSFSLPTLGLLVSIALLVVISMLASHEFKWLEAVGVCVVMLAIVYGVFIYGLKMTVSVLPPFLGT
jgi:hypothetical protein